MWFHLTLLTATRLLHNQNSATNSAWIPSRSRTCLTSDRRGSLMNTDWWPGTWGEQVLFPMNTQQNTRVFWGHVSSVSRSIWCLSSSDQLCNIELYSTFTMRSFYPHLYGNSLSSTSHIFSSVLLLCIAADLCSLTTTNMYYHSFG